MKVCIAEKPSVAKDIAEVLEVSVGSLKAQYHHAVKKIENNLKDD